VPGDSPSRSASSGICTLHKHEPRRFCIREISSTGALHLVAYAPSLAVTLVNKLQQAASCFSSASVPEEGGGTVSRGLLRG